MDHPSRLRHRNTTFTVHRHCVGHRRQMHTVWTDVTTWWHIKWLPCWSYLSERRPNMAFRSPACRKSVRRAHDWRHSSYIPCCRRQQWTHPILPPESRTPSFLYLYATLYVLFSLTLGGEASSIALRARHTLEDGQSNLSSHPAHIPRLIRGRIRTDISTSECILRTKPGLF